MTIEDQEAPARCRNCGAWLPRTALECPQCGALRELQMGGMPRRRVPTRWLVAAGAGLALVIGAVAWGVVQTTAPDPVAQESVSAGPSATPVASPTPSVTPSPRSSPTATAQPTPTPEPIRTPAPTPLPPRPPLVLGAGYADIGSRGVVTADGLRVRYGPGLDAEIATQLEAGTDLLMYEGPVASDGLDWYQVVFAATPYETYGELAQGWVAVGPSGGEPNLVRIDPPRCPNLTISATFLGATGGLARRDCLSSGSLEFSAVVDTCIEGPITPYAYTPQWLWFSCFAAFDLGSSTQLPLFFPPGVDEPDGLARGSVVHVVGHFDDAAAATCHVAVQPGAPVEPPSASVQAMFRLDCAAHFVLEEIEIVDQIDLPPRF